MRILCSAQGEGPATPLSEAHCQHDPHEQAQGEKTPCLTLLYEPRRCKPGGLPLEEGSKPSVVPSADPPRPGHSPAWDELLDHGIELEALFVEAELDFVLDGWGEPLEQVPRVCPLLALGRIPCRAGHRVNGG